MKPVHTDLVNDLLNLVEDFHSLGKDMASIFVFYLPLHSSRFIDTLSRMEYWVEYAKKDYGDYDHLLYGLRTTLEDWKSLLDSITVAFNNAYLHKRQWVYWGELYKLIGRFETLIERFEERKVQDLPYSV